MQRSKTYRNGEEQNGGAGNPRDNCKIRVPHRLRRLWI